MLTHALYLFHPALDPRLLRLVQVDGVSIFFVLSGYLIGGILLRETERPFGKKDLFIFWKRRWLRTLPAYGCLLLVLTVHITWYAGWNPAALSYPFFLQCLRDGRAVLFPESWSLCVEEWFYLLLPVTLMAIPHRHRKAGLLAVIVAVIISTTLSRWVQVHTDYHRYRSLVLSRQTFACLDGIAFGVLGAWLRRYRPITQRRLCSWIGILLILAMQVNIALGGENALFRYGWHTLVPLGVLLTLPGLAAVKQRGGPLARFVSFVALLSYALYLVHWTAFERLLLPFVRFFPTAIQVGFFIGWAFGAAYLLHRLVERPFLRLRERIAPPPVRPPLAKAD